jgi:seryl-tRNA synthetase
MQIKKIRSLIDEAMEKNNDVLLRHALERDEVLREIANWVHDSVPVSNDEDKDNRTERTSGDVESRKKYSHVDLIHMIDGMDAERGTVTAGGRGYYLKVLVVVQHLLLSELRVKWQSIIPMFSNLSDPHFLIFKNP